MDDKKIIELYFLRNEQAIVQTDNKYHAFCYSIAKNILTVHEDAQESVNDTYLTMWNLIPPTVPGSFKAFLGRITRNLAISKYRKRSAKKRYAGLEIMLSELNDCVPDSSSADEKTDLHCLTVSINAWLQTLGEDERALFICRYWYGEGVKTLAQRRGKTANATAQKLFALRKDLKAHLEKENIL